MATPTEQQQQQQPPLPEAYEPNSLLITGGAGFIGSNAVIHMVNKFPNCKVVCVDKLDYCSSLHNLDSVMDKPNFKFVRGNLCSHSFMSYLFKAEQIDTVIHYAASTHVDNSFGNSFSFTENNVMGTHVMLESAHEYGKVRRFIHVSTDEVYGETSRTTHVGDSAMEDNTLLSPTNPYAASKAGAEFLAMSYYKSYKLPLIITRGNNVYGPRQYPEKLIPKFTMLLMNGKKMTIHGSGLEKRNHLFVGDAVKAFEKILVYGQIGEIYNIGTAREVSNLEVATKLAAIFGHSEGCMSDHITHVDNRLFNDFRYNLDLSKLTNLGWSAEVDFDDGLRRTVEWYRQFGSKNWTPQQISCALVAHPRLQGVSGADSVHTSAFS
eukprot:TRINITY_DN1095_c1_g2_i1.p1 TRINITY_DN1095_c1_g2~~TRINITY_DN1095_c1_g2_i1.p1  ORF type:complete len:400 (-),score=144.45 TRINITY_DN1095_c1_g2_i1:81-1217(-)